MGKKDGKRQEAEIRQGTHQGCDGDNAANRDRQSRRDGDRDGLEWTLGADFKDWAGRNPAIRVALRGGVLSQLIAEAEGQLEGVQESIAWYERRRDELRARLERLQRLKSSLDE